MNKIIYVLALFLSFSTSASSGDDEKKTEKEPEVNQSQPITYVVGIVKRGENWKKDSLRAFELQEQHLKFIESLIANDKLMASGPLMTSPDARGLYVFNVKTIKEAQELTSKDEAMSSGWIAMDYHVWKSRDYSIPETVTEVVEEESNMPVKAIAISFAVVILVLVLRTFRYKESV